MGRRSASWWSGRACTPARSEPSCVERIEADHSRKIGTTIMAGFDPQILKQGQQATAKALQDRKALTESIAAQSAQIDALQKQIGGLKKAGEPQHADILQAQLEELKAARTEQQRNAHVIDAAWLSAINRFVLDPCDADPSFPLLLLPVRLETRYTADGKTLRIRIFPDDIHVDQLDRGLS